MILLWGPADDEPLTCVRAALHRRDAEVLLLDDELLDSTRVEGSGSDPTLRLAGRTYPMSQIRGCYPRPFRGPSETTAGGHGTVRRHRARTEARLWQWASSTEATMLNRPTPGATNCTKTWQTRIAHECGFSVPPTLVTNDVVVLEDFARRHGPLIYKAAGGARTIVTRLELPLGDRTDGRTESTDSLRLSDLATVPTYFQACITGTNTRVHLVGPAAFAVSISCAAVDYRYGGARMTRTTLPRSVIERCRRVCERLELPLAGIDLIHGDDGEWYFLEANSSPAFTFFAGRDEVADAIAGLLVG